MLHSQGLSEKSVNKLRQTFASPTQPLSQTELTNPPQPPLSATVALVAQSHTHTTPLGRTHPHSPAAAHNATRYGTAPLDRVGGGTRGSGEQNLDQNLGQRKTPTRRSEQGQN
ncbi:MAG: hypothetical protein ACK5NX_02825, partial [Armatimonadota bacterium]